MFTQRILSFGFAAVITLLPAFATANNPNEVNDLPLKQNQQLIEQQGQTVTQKAKTLNETSQQVQDLQAKKAELARQLEENKQKVDALRQQVAQKQAPQPAPATVASAPAPSGPIGSCGDNYYASYIYGQESGGKVVGNCNPRAQNAGGCLGIGQACPGSKLLAVCPNLDYACENAYFTEYANRYGGWAGAYQFWIGHGWW